MTDIPSALDLTRELVAFDTINPPGNEGPCLERLGALLERAGFRLAWHGWRPGRPNLVARLPATSAGERRPLAFSGHVDTVPLGQAAWSVDPCAGEVRDGRLYGRGTSDMKSGVAALVVAALRLARREARSTELVLVLSVGEETGCEGVLALAERPDLLGEAGAMIVAEPTDGRPFVGHKGALWMSLIHRGVTAHGSMPEKGRNAIFTACASVEALRRFDFAVEPHSVMGSPTLNLGTLAAGMNLNSVPDLARLGVDIRTVAGQSNADVRDAVASAVGAEVEIETLADMEPVFTDPADPFLRAAVEIAAGGADAAPQVATYFTDASVLKRAMGDPPTLIMGPGAMAMAHQTDEWCEVAKLDPCVDAYAELGERWLA